jgi:hypothetical protein
MNTITPWLDAMMVRLSVTMVVTRRVCSLRLFLLACDGSLPYASIVRAFFEWNADVSDSQVETQLIEFWREAKLGGRSKIWRDTLRREIYRWPSPTTTPVRTCVPKRGLARNATPQRSIWNESRAPSTRLRGSLSGSPTIYISG